jgi:hypothetical protein
MVNWGAQILSIYAAPTELVPNFLRHYPLKTAESHNN